MTEGKTVRLIVQDLGFFFELRSSGQEMDLQEMQSLFTRFSN